MLRSVARSAEKPSADAILDVETSTAQGEASATDTLDFLARLTKSHVVAAFLGAVLTLSFWGMCHRSLTTNAPTWVDGPVLDILESFHSGRVYQAAALRTMPYTVLTHTPLSYVVDYELYKHWPGFAALRMINILATLACAALIFHWVRIRTKMLAAAVFAVAAFLLMPPVFQWSQMTRSPDAFCCLFSLAALMAMESRRRYRNAVIAVCFTAAVLSKQTALLILLPTLLILEYREQRSLRRAARWFLPAVAVLGLFAAGMQWATHGGFWINVFDANLNPQTLGRFFFIAVVCLYFFWVFVACVFCLGAETRYTSAHIWAIIAIVVGLATCGKAGSDTMYFFDASAAVALLAGLALRKDSPGRAAILVCSLLLCALVSDATIAHINAPVVGESYGKMLSELHPFPTILSDEASISIRTSRAWYWGDPMVLNGLGRQGKWDSSAIEQNIAERRYSAIVIWNRRVWSDNQLKLVNRNYVLWKTYPAFKSHYSVYLPVHH